MKIKTIAFFAALLVGAGAYAAPTPVVVWDGDFTSTQSGYTLNLNGNAISHDNSTITIDQSVGVTVTKDDGTFSSGFTVLVRYSDLNIALADKQVLATSTLTDANDRTGVSINKSGQSCGIWAGASWSNSGTYNSMTSDQSSGVLAFMHYSTTTYSGAGTKLFSLGKYSAASTAIMDAGSLGSDNDKAKYKGFAVGGRGVAADGFSPATGMKITGIAVFDGILSESDMFGYRWPTDVTIPVDEDVSVSALNAQLAQASRAFLTVTDGVTLTLDEAFDVPVAISSEGSVVLSAASQPDASYFANVDFSGVQCGVLRSWLTPGVVGFNFNANGGRSAQGNTDGAADTALALEIGTWHKDAYSPSGSSTAMFADGLSVLTWTSKNVYAEAGSLTAGTFIQGYLDDGNNVNITLSNVPYETYDVIIYCSTDDSSKSFKAKTVNGTIYTWDATAGATTTTDSDTATWGLASAAAGKAVYGANTLRINGLSGPLSIKGGTSGNNARGCISAIQIMPAGTSTAPEMTVGTAGQTAQATWTGANWNVATAPTSGNVVINVAGDVELAIDETVALSAITVNGEGTLKIIPDQANNVTFTAGSILSAVPLLFANDGIGIDTISAPVTYLYKTPSITSSTYGNTYTAGVGSQEASVAVNHNGGSVVLDGTAGNTYYISASDNATATTVVFTNATATYSTSLGVGAATYIVAGQSAITAGVNTGNPQSFVLSQGGGSRASTFLLKDSSTVIVTGTSDVDSNQASVMFGHWNGPSTFIIQDSAAFTATCQVLVGKTANNHAININGGTFTAKGIKASASASGTNRLNLNGGLLVLGDVGITSYGSTTIGVNVSANSEIRASAATLPISQPVTIASGEVLSFTKATDVSAATVSLAGAVSGTGDISVGPGVTLNLGTNRPEGEISVDADGALAVVMASKADLPVLKVSSDPASVILYDTDGTTVLSGANVIYDAEAGTITVLPPVNTWNVASDLNFDTAGNWSYGLPESTQDTAIKVTGDAELTIAGTYEAATLTVSGSGVVEFSGAGSFTVGTLYLNDGATLAPNSKIVAASIVLDGGTVLRLKDTTESAPISGAGAVETYGAVTFDANNTFTGGLTVKSGSDAKTIKTGISGQAYGKNNYSQAIANLSRIVVEDGGSLDLANTADACYAITISGKGVYDAQSGVYKGALYNSGPEIGYNSRQTASLTLSADAMVKAELSNNGWGIVNSGHAASVLALNGHTLTVSGAGYFPIVNANTASGTQTTGTLIADGVTLGLVGNADKACNLTGVNVIAKGCATINVATAPSALGSLTLKPSASGTTASSWSLPSGFVPSIDTSNVDPAGLTDGQVLTLFTAPSATELTAETIAVKAGGRYTTTISGNTVTATVVDVLSAQPFLHYDFDAENSIAADSKYNIGNLNPVLVDSPNGKAGTFDSSTKPYYGSNTSGKSPFHAGEMSASSLVMVKEANNTILWNFGSGWSTGMALIAKDTATISLVSWTGGADGIDVVSVTGITDLMDNWHRITFVANANGTTLYVDGHSATTSTVLPADISGQGQFGSIHGTAKNYAAVTGDGYLLDDWRVYDTALTYAEVATFIGKVTITVPPVEHTTATVVASVGDVVDNGNNTYTVVDGATVTVAYTSDDYEVTGGTFEFTATDGYAVDTAGVVMTLYVASITEGTTTNKYTSIQNAITATVGSAATITVITASDEGLTIPADTRVAIDDASGLFTGDITVEESGILDLSNRQADACVACTNLTLAAGAGLWLPEGVTGSVKVAEKLIADALVDIKIGDAYTQTFTVASSDTGVLALRALRATAKPVAVWNADFGTGAITRGGFTLDLNNGDNTQDLTVTNDTTITIGAGAAGGVRFMREAASGYQLTAIARINTGGEVDVSATPVLFSLRNTRINNDNIIGVGFGDDGYMYGLWAGEKTSSDATELGDKPVFSGDWLFVAGRFWSMAASDSTVTHGTYGYWDGNQAVHDWKVRNDSERVWGVTLGGLYADNTKNLGGAQIDYVAIFDCADETLDDGVPAWSLANMTTVETLPATATALAGGSTTGFNLSGGTITISEPTAAAAVFVQEDTTLKFTGSGSLTIANNGLYFGPVYVAEGKTLTIDALESEIDAGALIHGAIYGQVAIDANDTVTTLAYIADDGLYHRGGWPTESKVLTIVVNGDAAIMGGDFTGLKALTVAGAGTLTMTGCALEADEFTLDAGVSLTLDDATDLSATTAAIDGTLTAQGLVTNATLTVSGTLNATNVIATTVEVAGSMAIAAGGTLEATTLTVAGDFTTAGTVTVPTINVTGTLTTAGEVTATTVNALGESFTMAAGGNLTVNGDRGLRGTVTVEQGGKLTSGHNDAMNYDGSCTVHLYGQLDFGTTRWTLNANNRIYLYEGCEISGTGDSTKHNAVMDLLGAAVLLNVTGNVTIDNNFRIRGNANIYVNDDSKLTLNGLLGYDDEFNQSGQLIKSGGGTMVINGASTSPDGLNAYVGTIKLGTTTSVTGPVRVQAQGTLDVADLTDPVIAGAVTIDKCATVVVPDDTDLGAGVQLTTNSGEGALTVNSYATIVQGETTYTNVSVQVLANNKLAMVAQTEHSATINGNTTWSNIAWTPDLPEDASGRKLIINVNTSAVINGNSIDKTAGTIVFNVAQDCMLSLTNLTLSANLITVNGGAVKVYSADALTGTIVGNGTVIYTGVMPASPADKFTNLTWHGTLWLERQHGITDVTFANFGNVNSTLRLTDMQLWCNGGDFAGTLDLSNADSNGDPADYALEINNGASTQTTTFAKLTGSGTVRDTDNAATHTFVFNDVSDFTGSIKIVGGKRIKIGAGSKSVGKGQIVVQPEAVATVAGDATWSAANGIHVYGTVNIAGVISGSVQCYDGGKFVVTGDNAALGDLRDFAHVELGTGVTRVQVAQTQSEYLNGVTEITNVSATIAKVVVKRFDNSLVEVTVEGNVVRLDEGAHPAGKAALYDFTFNAAKYQDNIAEDATFPNFGSLSDNKLSTDRGGTTATSLDNEAPNNLYVRTSPYITAGNYPSTFTAVVYGTMPAEENNTLIAFGYGTGGFLALVRGETVNDVDLVWCNSDANNKEVISPMRAKAATATKHLYVFTKSEEYISVYLDGQLQIRKKYNSKWTLGYNGGFQIGSVLEGEVSGVATRPAADDPAVVELVRIFGEELSDAVMAKLVEDYPFIDITTASTRTLEAADGTNTWYSTEVGTWANTPEDDGHLPVTNANVVLTVAGEVPQWMSVVLNADTVDAPNAIGDLHITGSQALTIRKSIGGHPVSISGVLTNEVDLTIHYGALDMAASPLKMGATGRIIFDLTELVDGKRDTEPVYLTGVCEDGASKDFDNRISYVNNSDNNLISLAGFAWDIGSKRYCATFTASRGNKEVYFEPVEGGADNLFNKDSAVYYLQDETRVPTYIIAGDTLCFLVEEAATVTIATNDELVAVAGYKIPAGVTVVFNEDLTVPVEGAGTIVMNKCKPQVTIDAVKNSLQDSEKWTGTLAIERVEFGNTSLSKLGNANSTIRLAGCSIYPQASYEVASTLEIDNATYGYGLHLRGVSAGGDTAQEIVFDKLAGSGLLMNIADEEVTTHHYLRIKDASEFSGPITNDAVGVTMLFGTGEAAEGSVVITADTSFSDALNLRSSMWAATNLIVRSNLIVGEKDVRITADSVDFGTGGTIALTGEDQYPIFIVQNQITGTIYVSLENFANLLAVDDITVLRVNKAEYLPPIANVQCAPGAAQDYTLVIDADGKGYSLVNEGFYIRIR